MSAQGGGLDAMALVIPPGHAAMARRPGGRVARVALAALALAALSACDRAQVMEQGKRKPDTPAWQGTDNKFADSNWKRGDATSWEEQLRKRSQGQDEYSRSSK